MSRIKPGDLIQLNENSPYATVYLFTLHSARMGTTGKERRVTKADLCTVISIVSDELFILCNDIIGWTSLTSYFNVVS